MRAHALPSPETTTWRRKRRRSWSPVGNPWQGVVPAGIFLILFFVVPFLMVVGYSFVENTNFGADVPSSLTLAHYAAIFADDYSVRAWFRSILFGVVPPLVATPFAFAIAYFLAFVVPPRWRRIALFALIAPFWTSFTIRAFSWQLVLSDQGLVNYALRLVGLDPVSGMLHSTGAALLGLTLFAVMLMTLTLFTVMETIERRYFEAAHDLGASSWTTFRLIVVPLALPGWIIGAVLAFTVCVGDYAVPTLLGNSFQPVLAQLMESSLRATLNVPQASAYAVLLIATVIVVAAPLLAVLRRVAR